MYIKELSERWALSNKLFYIAVVLLFVSYPLRIINIEQDLPAWGIGYYQPVDEGAYAHLAINKFEYGEVVPLYTYGNAVEKMYIPPQMCFNGIQNVLVYLGLKNLGDNYYGLRVPIVVTCMFALVVEFFTMLLIVKKYSVGNYLYTRWLAVLFTLLTSYHFYFYIASRTVEPSVMRMIAVELLILIMLFDFFNEKIKFFCLGLITTLSVFFCYLTNAFLYMAIGILLVLASIDKKKKVYFVNSVAVLSGILVAVGISYYVFDAYFQISPIYAIKDVIESFKDVPGYKTVAHGRGVFHSIFGGVGKFFSSFTFFYMPAVLLYIIIFGMAGLFKTFKEKDYRIALVFYIPMSFLIYTMISDDYIWRKSIMILPCFMYIILWGCLQYEFLNQYINSGTLKRRRLKLLFVMLSSLATCVFIIYHLLYKGDRSGLDLDLFTRMMIVLMTVIPVVIWTILKARRSKHGVFLFHFKELIIWSGLSIALSLCLLFYHVWWEPSYCQKQMLTELSTKYNLDDTYIIGDCIAGVTLYNDLKPVCFRSSEYADKMMANKKLLLHTYSKNDTKKYLDEIVFADEDYYSAQEIIRVPGTFQTFGRKYSWGIYKATERRAIVQESRERYYANLINGNSEHDSDDLYDEDTMLYPDLKELQYDIDKPIFVNIRGDVHGNVNAPIYGDVFGNIYGNVYAPIYGKVYGNIYGVCYEGKRE